MNENGRLRSLIVYNLKSIINLARWYTFESIFDGEKFSLRIYEGNSNSFISIFTNVIISSTLRGKIGFNLYTL